MANFKLRASIELSNGSLLAGLVIICIWLGTQGKISAADIALVFTLTNQLLNMSGWVLSNTATLAEQYGKIVDAIQALVKPLTVQDQPGATNLEVTAGSITLQDATFQYGRGVGGILGINLEIEPGELVGVVGISGGGKSSLVAAICRYFDLESGAILIDGQNIAQVTQRSLRQALGVITQEPEIFHRSIRDNIAYGKPDATEEEIIAAARKAKAHDFIINLQDLQGRKGYDAVVGERGIRLSGGQRQRIAIARTLLANRPILILDEATSALDSESEAAIQENLGLLMQGRTVIVIAHRLSTLKAMNRIVVMDAGRIVECGTQQQLLNKGGIYAQLWNLQTQGFLPAEAA
jgi:ATP-binding cassette subfamily B multidrug efflux pump